MELFACVLGLLATVAVAAPVVIARVQDGETGKPLAGAIVMSEGSDVMAATDSGGLCRVVVPPRKGGALVASQPGYRDCVLAGAWPARPEQDTVVIDFRLLPKRPGTEAVPALPGAPVADTSSSPPGPSQPVAPPAKLPPKELTVEAKPTEAGQAKSSFGGAIRFGNADSSPSTLGQSQPVAPPAKLPPKELAVEARRTEAREVRASFGDTISFGSVEGTVSDIKTGLSVPAAQVAVAGTRLKAETDSAGHYVIEYVPAGTHKLLVTCSGFVPAYTVVRLVRDWAVTVDLHLRKKPPQPSAPAK